MPGVSPRSAPDSEWQCAWREPFALKASRAGALEPRPMRIIAKRTLVGILGAACVPGCGSATQNLV